MGEIVRIAVGDSDMDCYVAYPNSDAIGGILVCMHGPGVDEFIRDICKRLASENYLVIAPNFYHRQGTELEEPWKKVDDSEAIDDMRAGIGFLTSSLDISVGVVGFCMGGRLAFLQLANDDRLSAGVIFHGGNIMQSRGGLSSPLEQAHKITAPVLGIFGGEDSNPSPADRDVIEDRLSSLKIRHRFVTYEGAGHAFLNFTRPAVFREEQAVLAWTLCLEWLREEMRGGA
jgi:carboxymethylenebutenolidase